MSATAPRSGPAALARPACDSATLRFTLAGAAAGEERYEISCRPDGSYEGRGHTVLTVPGAAFDLESTISLDVSLNPVAITVKGSAGGQPIEQRVQFANGMATVTSGAASQQIPYTKGSAYIGRNIFYLVPLLLARYDEAKGGVQPVALFPTGSVTIEHQGHDDVRGDGATASSATTRFERYFIGAGPGSSTVWLDDGGRLAVVSAPSQQFSVVRTAYASFAAALIAAGTTRAPSPSAAPAAPPSPPIDYSAPAGASFGAHEVTVPAAGYSLAGTLLLPNRLTTRVPAVVMITGSGQQTRDEPLPIPGLEGYRPFRQIAESLAASGIAVLRVDDRGVGNSTGRETLASATTSSFADDTRAQVAWLRARPEIDPARIALIGHSEGGTIAGMVAAGDTRIRAVVLMAAVGRTGAEVAVEQTSDIVARQPTMSAEEKAAAIARQREAVRTVLAGGTVPGATVNAWTREYFVYDPLATIRKVRQPLLIMQGEYDRQVFASHATLLADAAKAAGNRDVTVRIFPALNHLFLPSKTGAFSEYGSLESKELPDEVVGTMRSWLKEKLRQ